MAAVDRELFDKQMMRLSRAFNHTPARGMGDEYWGRLKHHDLTLFTMAVDRLLDESDRFPNIATIHKVYYEERDKALAVTAEMRKTDEAMREAGRKNAARIAREGLPSDRWPARPVPVGSRRHEQVLGVYERTITTLTNIVYERGAQLDAHPDDRDLARRYGVLTNTLSEMCEDRDIFERTGLAKERVPFDPNEPDPVPAGTLFLCPVCKSTEESRGGFVRVEVQPGSKHFGGAGGGSAHTPIPCPACNRNAYARYVTKYGVPPGMPKVMPDGAANASGSTQTSWKDV